MVWNQKKEDFQRFFNIYWRGGRLGHVPQKLLTTETTQTCLPYKLSGAFESGELKMLQKALSICKQFG